MVGHTPKRGLLLLRALVVVVLLVTTPPGCDAFVPPHTADHRLVYGRRRPPFVITSFIFEESGVGVLSRLLRTYDKRYPGFTPRHPTKSRLCATPWSFEEARAYARSFGFASREEYDEYRCPGAYALPRNPVVEYGEAWTSWEDYLGLEAGPPMMSQVLFVECGVGADQHGQNVTKAAVRAARNAIEFNSIACVEAVVPRGYDGMLLKLDVAAPSKYHDALDLDAVKAVFPYGRIVACDLQPGGALFRSGVALEAMGDSSDEMIVVNVAVTVGY